MECELPRVNSNQEEIKSYFEQTKTIAVIGASPNESKDSHHVAKYLKEVGYKMIPIYPKHEEILGEKVYRSLKEVPDVIDMVVIFRKPEALAPIAEAIIERGDIKTYWTQRLIINNAVAQKVEDAGIHVVQNQCAMLEHRAIFGEA
jgi:predicted CoA-binding protein